MKLYICLIAFMLLISCSIYSQQYTPDSIFDFLVLEGEIILHKDFPDSLKKNTFWLDTIMSCNTDSAMVIEFAAYSPHAKNYLLLQNQFSSCLLFGSLQEDIKKTIYFLENQHYCITVSDVLKIFKLLSQINQINEKNSKLKY